MSEVALSSSGRGSAKALGAPAPVAGRFRNLASSGARVLWSFVVPLMLAATILRELVPSPAVASGTWAEPLAVLAARHRLWAFVLTTLAVGLVFRHWLGPFYRPAVQPAQSSRRRASEVAGAMALAGALGFGFRTAAGTYEVLSASMLPALEPEDIVLGVRGALMGRASADGVRLKRGDIAVFETPAGLDAPPHMIKRVIGLPGDRISMNGPHAVINGWEVPSCDAGGYFYPLSSGGGVAGRLFVEFLGDAAYLTVVLPFEASWPETYQVPPGELFVLGDNRSNSADSRSWNGGKGGSVPVGDVVARVALWLTGTNRDQSLDLVHALRPLGSRARLDGIDTSELRAGIERCLASRPKDTRPPEPSAAP
jgi:signal peptidase I